MLTIADLDGRTNAAKAAKALIAEIESDLGGGDRLTAGDKAIVARAAVTTAMIEHMETAWLLGQGLDTNACTALVNVQRRLLTTLGLQRRPGRDARAGRLHLPQPSRRRLLRRL